MPQYHTARITILKSAYERLRASWERSKEVEGITPSNRTLLLYASSVLDEGLTGEDIHTSDLLEVAERSSDG